MNRERAAENQIASVLENTLGSTGRCRSASNLCYGLGFAQRLPSNRGKMESRRADSNRFPAHYERVVPTGRFSASLYLTAVTTNVSAGVSTGLTNVLRRAGRTSDTSGPVESVACEVPDVMGIPRDRFLYPAAENPTFTHSAE